MNSKRESKRGAKKKKALEVAAAAAAAAASATVRKVQTMGDANGNNMTESNENRLWRMGNEFSGDGRNGPGVW